MGIILVAREAPRTLARLVARIQEEVPGARVRGILYELSSCPRGLATAAGPQPRARRQVLSLLASFCHGLLRFLHASPAQPNGPMEFGLEELSQFCTARGSPLFVTEDFRSPAALAFAKSLQPELGIVCGGRQVPAELLTLPRRGFLLLQKTLPEPGPGRSTEAPSLQSQEMILTVRRLEVDGTAGCLLHTTTVPREPLDTASSLALKANLVGNDLLVRTVSELAGDDDEARAIEAARLFHQSYRQDVQSMPAAQAADAQKRRRPVWKLLVKTLLFFPYVVARNWARRRRGSFPVTILFHHVVTDRLHPLGISTERFFQQIQFLRKHYKIASLKEALAMLRTGTAKAPTVVLTFDDGYQENFLGLRAVLEETGIPVALFVCPQLVTTQQEFDHDCQRGQRGFLPLTWEQITYLSRRGVEIGSHTRSHFDCGSSDRVALWDEIVGSQLDLELRLEHPVRIFSFPWGHPANMSPQAVELAKTAYCYVCSAFGGANLPSRNGQPWHLRRCAHPNSLWELELALQSVLELRLGPSQLEVAVRAPVRPLMDKPKLAL